jgi:hypothetical protein
MPNSTKKIIHSLCKIGILEAWMSIAGREAVIGAPANDPFPASVRPLGELQPLQ